MSTTLPPLDEARTGGPSGPGKLPPPDPGGGGRPPRRPPGRRSLAILLVGSAILGGATSTGILALSGQLDGGTTTTTVVRSSTVAASDGASTIDARAIYTSASPGVVNITATGVTSSSPGPFGQGSGTATGSGFVIDKEGHILTAAHVVDGAQEITIEFADGTKRTATVTGTDDATDVAVLKVNPQGLTLQPLELGTSASLEVGDAVAAIGSPFGYESSISTGVVSGLDRAVEAPNGFTVSHAIQTDAALNPGNSGGPILDSTGKVVGIADQIATGGSEQNAGVGFAVPIDVVAGNLDALKAGTEVRHPYLGVSTTEATNATGAVVAEVTSGSPAASAGLEAGDVVTAVDGTAVADSSDLVAAVAAKRPGDRIELTITRDGQTRTLTATLGNQPATRSQGGG